MQTIHRLDSTIYGKALRKEAALWQSILAAMSAEWQRGWSLGWALEPSISSEEIMEDLRFGRE